MYAVIRTGGKQYKVSVGDVLEVEHLAARDQNLRFTPVLVVTDDGRTIYGARELKAYSVEARMLGDAKGDKVTVFKYRPKTGYATKRGHRQLYSLIEVTGIGGGPGGAAAHVETPVPETPAETPEPETPEPETPAETPEPEARAMREPEMAASREPGMDAEQTSATSPDGAKPAAVGSEDAEPAEDS
ncbi:MAG: 50S ribosomal protein L21 [Actinomycetota bacterium]